MLKKYVDKQTDVQTYINTHSHTHAPTPMRICAHRHTITPMVCRCKNCVSQTIYTMQVNLCLDLEETKS